MGRVVVAMDPHKRSATIEVMDAEETVLGGGRFGTDAAGFAAMKTYAAASWTVMSLSPARGLSGLGGLSHADVLSSCVGMRRPGTGTVTSGRAWQMWAASNSAGRSLFVATQRLGYFEALRGRRHRWIRGPVAGARAVDAGESQGVQDSQELI